MSMRDKIAEIVSEAECSDDRGFGSGVLKPDAISDAILVTIKASVPELVWGDHLIASPSPYQIWSDNGGSGSPDDPYEKYNNFRVFEPTSMFSVGPKNDGSDEFDTLEQAKAAAQAHHVAQLTGWMDK